MQIRAVLVTAGALAIGIADAGYFAHAQAGKPAPRPASRGPAASASQPVKGLTNQQIFDYQMRSAGSGNPAGGRAVFEKQCARCHKFGSLGNEVGPDLSTLKSRFTRKDVLESVLWPSRTVADQYRAVVVETKDGETKTGVVAREDASRMLLKTEQEPTGVRIQKADITDRRVTDKSLMPDGLLKEYSQQDISNLLAFLLGTPPA